MTGTIADDGGGEYLDQSHNTNSFLVLSSSLVGNIRSVITKSHIYIYIY